MSVKNNRFNIRSSWFDSYVSGKSKAYNTAQLGNILDVSVWGPTSTLHSTQVFTSPASSVTLDTGVVEIIAVGGGGGAPTHPTPNPGGQGGITLARYNIPTTTPLIVLVGGTGANGEPGPGDGGAGYDPTSNNTGAGGPGYSSAPPGGSFGGTGGGAASGVFTSSVTQGNALVVAGGGGGEGYSSYGPDGGNGGGAVGGAGGDPGTGTGGGGGSNPTNAGGAAGVDQSPHPTPPSPNPIPYAGSALQGGANPSQFNSSVAYAGGGGGGGYWGGGGGGGSSTTSGANSAGGGGGSGYFSTSNIGDIEYYPSPTAERNYQGMGYAPGAQGTGGPYPLGAGKDHPQLSPLGTEYGNGGIQGYVIINFYKS